MRKTSNGTSSKRSLALPSSIDSRMKVVDGQTNEAPMNQVAREFGQRNAKAQAELARFAFLENGVRNRKRRQESKTRVYAVRKPSRYRPRNKRQGFSRLSTGPAGSF
jgi:hypothetical protein